MSLSLLQASLTVATINDAAAANKPLQMHFSDEINVLVDIRANWEPLKATTLQCIKVNLPVVGWYHVSLKLELFGSDKYCHHHCHDNSNVAVTAWQQCCQLKNALP